MTTATADAPASTEKRGFPGLAQLQRIGRSLMLPIASLPAAALLLRLGQPDMLGDGRPRRATLSSGCCRSPTCSRQRATPCSPTSPLLFAVGVAVGFARKSDGSTALAAVIGYLVFKGVSHRAVAVHPRRRPAEGETQELINYGVLGGIVMGLVAAAALPEVLPDQAAALPGVLRRPALRADRHRRCARSSSRSPRALIYPAFDAGFTAVGEWVTGSTVLGGFVYGTANRLLVPIGLHHLLNSMPWFQFGEYTDANGEVWNGDIARFLHGDPTAGTFMTGFFPIMMFALPAAALAIVHTSKAKNRKVIAGIMGSAALVSFVTGVTEPLEFAFVYVAYPLYAIHAVLTGTSLALVNALGIRDGFGFSAGAIDYVLNFRIADEAAAG